jgi:mannose-1-phosphate guanylyltransferase/mannose-6-phosphate isomerase
VQPATVVVNEDHRFLVADQVRICGRQLRRTYVEPFGRSTAPALGIVACDLFKEDPEALMLVLPADHDIPDEAQFAEAVETGSAAASQGRLVVFGLAPRWAETGYGYIEFPQGTEPGAAEGPVAVRQFHEKPKLPAATEYVAAGNFYWNSGMFFWRVDVLLDELQKHLPKTAAALATLPRFGARDFAARLKHVFPQCDNISIDYAVLEKAAEVAGIPAGDFGWNDVGSWNAVYELLPRDESGNVTGADAVCLEANNNFVDARGKVVALLGVNDLIVVDTPDALLVASRDKAQQVGEILKLLEKRNRHDLL